MYKHDKCFSSERNNKGPGDQHLFEELAPFFSDDEFPLVFVFLIDPQFFK